MCTHRWSCHAVVMLLFLSGCATQGRNPDDPLEAYNRQMFDVNRAVDRTVVEPTAQLYQKIIPAPIRLMAHNFISNLGDVWIGVNNVFQGKWRDAASDAGRLSVNSTFGILGLGDVASSLGFPKHQADFGLTLAHWGVGEGPYVVLPFFGPSTLRDGLAKPVDLLSAGSVFDAGNFSALARNVTQGTDIVDTRASLLGMNRVLDGSGVDPYSFAKSAYLQHRRSLLNGGAINYDDE